MARPATGKEVLGKAKEALANARSVEQMREAQALILPLEHGFSMVQVAASLGISKDWACKLRRRFILTGGQPQDSKPKRGGRQRQNMTLEEKVEFLAPFFEKAARGGILIVNEVKQALDERHPKSDVEAQEEWEKNSRNRSPRSMVSGQALTQMANFG